MSTSDMIVLLGVVSAGLFFGLLAFAFLAPHVSWRRPILLISCVAVATAAAAVVVWSVLGYDAVARPGATPLH